MSVKVFFQYCPYWLNTLECGTPSCTSIAWRCAFVMACPVDAILARATSPGDPGISLGSAKFSVIAAQSVMTNSATFRRT